MLIRTARSTEGPHWRGDGTQGGSGDHTENLAGQVLDPLLNKWESITLNPFMVSLFPDLQCPGLEVAEEEEGAGSKG